MIKRMKGWLSRDIKTLGLIHFFIWLVIGAVLGFIVCYPMFNHYFH